MYEYINKRFGALFLVPFALICSVFLSTLFVDAASAATGVWTDRGTITVAGVQYKGPKDGTHLSSPGKVQLFVPSSGSGVVFFTLLQDVETSKVARFSTSSLSNTSEVLTLSTARPAAPPTGGGGAGGTVTGEDTPQATCAVDGVGWLICPIAGFLAKVTDGAYGYAKQLLYFEVKNPFSTDPAKNPIYTIWSSVRNVANIVFVLAFFAVIFSQATSMGISAYGIRKMLPRIVVAAIMVNLSYYICIFAIDISNIIGSGLEGFINSLPAAPPTKIDEGNDWQSLMSIALVGGAAIGIGIGMVMFAAGTVFAFLAFSVLAIFTAIAIFMARHVLLIMLIILSPLAFVAYILPNTENLFDKWRKTFVAMLVMFPLVAILFAGTKVASDIMRSTADQVGGELTWLYKLFALAVLALPLFGIPWIVKFSGGFIGRVAGMVNDRNKGLIDRARKAGDKGSAVRRAELGSNVKGGIRGLGNKAGLDKAGAWGYDAEGNKKKGLKSFAKRRAGGVLSAPTRAGFGEFERDARMSQVKEELQKAREAQLSGSISKEEFVNKETGELDKAAFLAAQQRRQKTGAVAATRAAGVGGAEGAKHIQRLAKEQSRKRYNEEVDRIGAEWISTELANANTKVEEIDEQGNVKMRLDRHGRPKAMDELGMHDRLAAITSGKRIRYTDSNGNVHVVDGSESEQVRAAAMKRIADTADKKAVGAVDLKRQLIQGKVDAANVKIEQVNENLASRGEQRLTQADEDDIMRRELGNEGMDDIKYSVKQGSADHALMMSYFGGSQGLAATNPHYRQSEAGAFNSPTPGKVAGFSNEEAQLAIQYYKNQEVKLEGKKREALASGSAADIADVNQSIANNNKAIERFITFYGQATQNENLVGGMDADAIVQVQKFATDKGVVFPTTRVQPRIAATVEFVTPPAATGGTPTIRSAADVRAQVTQAGGFDAINDQLAYKVWEHAGDARLASDPDVASLRAEAELDLKRRGVLPS